MRFIEITATKPTTPRPAKTPAQARIQALRRNVERGKEQLRQEREHQRQQRERERQQQLQRSGIA